MGLDAFYGEIEKCCGEMTVDVTALFHQVLMTTHFQWNMSFEQNDGVAMGSPLSLAVANFCMENFEEMALTSTPFKPKVLHSDGQVVGTAFLHYVRNSTDHIGNLLERPLGLGSVLFFC